MLEGYFTFEKLRAATPLRLQSHITRLDERLDVGPRLSSISPL